MRQGLGERVLNDEGAVVLLLDHDLSPVALGLPPSVPDLAPVCARVLQPGRVHQKLGCNLSRYRPVLEIPLQ